jgi:hypothetical protein
VYPHIDLTDESTCSCRCKVKLHREVFLLISVTEGPHCGSGGEIFSVYIARLFVSEDY